MSMLALPESECREILALFQQHLSHIPDAWLQELANNYGLDAVVDIDPNDVITILSIPGELHRIQISLAKNEAPEAIHRRMLAELATQGIKRERIAASLLTIKDSSAELAAIANLARSIVGDFGANGITGWGWYEQKANSDKELSWLISSLNSPP